MKYRRFLDLTDDEITEIVIKIFQPTKIGYIERSKKWNEIIVEITTEWQVDDEYPEAITEPITLRHTSNWCDCDFQTNDEDYWEWIKFLCDKRINPYYEALKEKEENN